MYQQWKSQDVYPKTINLKCPFGGGGVVMSKHSQPGLTLIYHIKSVFKDKNYALFISKS